MSLTCDAMVNKYSLMELFLLMITTTFKAMIFQLNEHQNS